MLVFPLFDLKFSSLHNVCDHISYIVIVNQSGIARFSNLILFSIELAFIKYRY